MLTGDLCLQVVKNVMTALDVNSFFFKRHQHLKYNQSFAKKKQYVQSCLQQVLLLDFTRNGVRGKVQYVFHTEESVEASILNRHGFDSSTTLPS